jgi:hypothetical protein
VLDALADRQLALSAVTLQVLWTATVAGACQATAQVAHERRHVLCVGLELGAVTVDVGF